MQASPKKLKPVHLLMIRQFAAGDELIKIASDLGYTAQQVMNVIHSEGAQEILAQLQQGLVDSFTEVQERLNEAAPQVVQRKIQIALTAEDKVASKACTDLLNMAGHAYVTKIQVEHKENPLDKYLGLTEDELRQKLIESLQGKGPDGRVLN